MVPAGTSATAGHWSRRVQPGSDALCITCHHCPFDVRNEASEVPVLPGACTGQTRKGRVESAVTVPLSHRKLPPRSCPLLSRASGDSTFMEMRCHVMCPAGEAHSSLATPGPLPAGTPRPGRPLPPSCAAEGPSVTPSGEAETCPRTGGAVSGCCFSFSLGGPAFGAEGQRGALPEGSERLCPHVLPSACLPVLDGPVPAHPTASTPGRCLWSAP